MEENDIIQVTDEAHAWYGCLLVVDEVRDWGVQAYIAIPHSNDGSQTVQRTFNRLNNGQYEKVGAAVIVRDHEMKD